MNSQPPDYAELHCISNFTFLRGASHPEELVQQAAHLGYTALAITDECSFAGVVRAHVAAKEHQLKLIIGTEVKLTDGPKLVLLAEDRNGYSGLSELITTARRRCEKGHYELDRHDLDSGLPACLAILLPEVNDDQASLLADARWLATRFAQRAWLAIELLHGTDDRAHSEKLVRIAQQTQLPLVACGDVHMHRRGRRPLQDLLTAIRLNTPLAQLGTATFSNGERHLRPRHVLQRLYQPAWMAESLRIAARCHFSLDSLRYAYPDDLAPPGETLPVCLRRLTYAGMQTHWPNGTPDKVIRQVEHELDIITELKYEPYFLTVYDIIRFARARNILYQGRGSAANSAVCFCLGITSVDPSRMEMLFERFVSRERDEPPDIDVDFEHERREEVIQYIYKRYGRDRAALTATLITYRRKSALRDAGKALGFSLDQVDSLSKAVAWWDEGIPAEQLRDAGFDPDNPRVQQLLSRVNELIGFPRHLSQHVGGFVIARDRLSQLVPIENAAMPERSVIQWDKDDLDTMGLLKVDCLGLGMLTAIQRAFAHIAEYRQRHLTLANLPPEDPAVYALIQKADTVGVFQIESRAQMSMLPRLRPACFYDLVIEVAIVRPGPIQGQMVHPYLKRRQGLEPVSYPSDAVRVTLERTLGVPIFQEQVIKLAMVAAGFSAGEADQLRRAIGAWRRRDTLSRFQQRLVEGMRARGYSETFAQQIYQQIQGFGEYGFPESHAASFALLVYVSAWLKHYEPAIFTCALLNSQPMGFYAPAQLVQDAKRHGVQVRPVEICRSEWDCTIESVTKETVTRDEVRGARKAHDGPLALRLGFRMVKGLSRKASDQLIAVRKASRFKSVADFNQRVRIAKKDKEALAAADAFAGLAGHRHLARWQILDHETPLPLLPAETDSAVTPLLARPSEGQELVADYASIGLSLRRHPLALLRKQLTARGGQTTASFAELADGERVNVIGLVVTRQHPASAGGVIFLTLEDETGHTNVIVWQDLTRRFRKEVLYARLLGVHGVLQHQDNVIHVVARRLVDHTSLLGELLTHSRDFR